MKKVLFAILALLLSVPMIAQTNFRKLTFEEAIEAAKAEKKLVFVDFFTTWCMPCKRMDAEVFPDAKLGAYMNEKFVSIKLDAEKEGKQLSDFYNVQAFPTFVVIDTDKKEVVRSVGLKMAEEFLTDMKRMLNPETSAKNLEAAYNRGERNALLIQNYTNSLMDGVNDRDAFAEVAQKAFDIVQDYFKGLSDADRVKPENMFIYRNYSARLHTPSAKFMSKNINSFPEEVRTEISDMVKQLYNDEVEAYFTAGTEMNAQKFNELKTQIQNANLDPKGKYKLMYKFIESYLQSDRAKYLDFCHKNFKKLTSKEQALFVNSFMRLFYKDSKEIKKSAAKFLRSQLAEMDANSLYYAALQIGELEK